MATPPEEIRRAVQELEDTAKEIGRKAFREWVELPEIKLLISMISPTVNAPPELLMTLLESAFTRGIAAGQTSIVGTLMSDMLRKRQPPG